MKLLNPALAALSLCIITFASARNDHNTLQRRHPWPSFHDSTSSSSSLSSTTSTKVDLLLHCLGKDPSTRADRPSITSLIESNSNPADDGVWSQLSPKTWGFSGHDTPGSDTWTPVEGAAKTAKDKVERQHQKLIGCAKKVFPKDEGNAGEQRRILPDMFGGSGFKQVRQGGGGQGDFPLRPPQFMSNDAASKPPLAYADAGGEKQDPTKSPGTGEDPGPGDMSVINGANGVLGGRLGNGNPLAAKEGDRDPAITDADVKNANGHPSALAAKDDTAASPADGQKPTPDDPSATSPTNNGQQDTTSAPTTDGDKTPTTDPNPTSADGTTPKLAPGLGPDVASVAPDLQNDPQQKLMPQSATSPADGTTAAAGLTDPKLSTPNTPNTTTSPDQLKPASLSPFTSPSPQDTATSSSCKSFLMRKEYSTLTDAEKAGYARALKCVRSKPSRFNTDPHFNAADDWTLLHIRMVKYVHFTAFFTVFHRGFIAIIEQDLVACGLPKGMGMPWVDWTKTSDDPSTNAFFSDNPEWGLGTNGKGDSSECPWGKGKAVIDGALRDHYFNAPFRHRLCRGFNNLDSSHPYPHFGNNCSTFINAHFVSGLGKTHDKGKFFDFSSALEISSHLSMHTCVGGGMTWLSTSPNDVVFPSHHGFIDNIFASWQNKSMENKDAFHGPKQQQKPGKHPAWDAKKSDVINFEPLADNVAAGDLLDHTSGKWGGRMCYAYDSAFAM